MCGCPMTSRVCAASSRSSNVKPLQKIMTASLTATNSSSVSTEKSQWNGAPNLFLNPQRTRYTERLYHLARFSSAHLFFEAIDIFRRAAALSLYPPRLRPGPAPLRAVIAARTRSKRCSSFVASFFKAFRICIAS